MKKFVWLLAVGVVCIGLSSKVDAQTPPKPGPEFDHFKQLVGSWDAAMEGGKGVMTYKMDLGGLWLVGNFEGEMMGQKFSGKAADSYDAGKKKYVGVWIDSMSTSPMTMEGTYDAAKKTLTMTGEGPGHDGKPAKFRMVSEMKDKDTIDWKMYQIGSDGKEAPPFSITYKRKK